MDFLLQLAIVLVCLFYGARKGRGDRPIRKTRSLSRALVANDRRVATDVWMSPEEPDVLRGNRHTVDKRSAA